MNLSNPQVKEILIPFLKANYPDGVFENVPLSSFSQWKTGGLAKLIFSPESIEQLSSVVQKCYELDIPYITIGSSTNLLFDDLGLDVFVIHIGIRLSRCSIEHTKIRCESGIWVPGLAVKIANHGLTGLEHIVGIPGTLGGLVCMNGGSLRRGVGENVTSVTTVRHDGAIVKYAHRECGFAYRQSLFQSKSEIIAEIELEGNYDSKRQIKSRMLKILGDRRRKFPRKIPNCGSVFVSDPAMYDEYGPPGKIIEACGLKGKKQGAAEISSRHANFIVNHGGASSEDILKLVHIAHESVKKATGYNMRSEAIFVSPTGQKSSVSQEAYERFSS